jgi:hypothetical protein
MMGALGDGKELFLLVEKTSLGLDILTKRPAPDSCLINGDRLIID